VGKLLVFFHAQNLPIVANHDAQAGSQVSRS